MHYPAITLSAETSLVYVLHESGCRGRLTAGRIERTRSGALDVFDEHGERVGYLSGIALRSWCVMDAAGVPIADWSEIMPEDVATVLSYSWDTEKKKM